MMTRDEARELKELTDAVIANLRTIDELGYRLEDLEDMSKEAQAASPYWTK